MWELQPFWIFVTNWLVEYNLYNLVENKIGKDKYQIQLQLLSHTEKSCLVLIQVHCWLEFYPSCMASVQILYVAYAHILCGICPHLMWHMSISYMAYDYILYGIWQYIIWYMTIYGPIYMCVCVSVYSSAAAFYSYTHIAPILHLPCSITHFLGASGNAKNIGVFILSQFWTNQLKNWNSSHPYETNGKMRVTSNDPLVHYQVTSKKHRILYILSNA